MNVVARSCKRRGDRLSPGASREDRGPEDTLILPPEDQFWNADLQNCGDNKCVLFCTVKFVIQRHSSNRKLRQ